MSGISTRPLDWDGCFNVRDLGGLPTEQGQMTRHRAVIRADSLARLRERGWASAEAEIQLLLETDIRSVLADGGLGEAEVAALRARLLDE